MTVTAKPCCRMQRDGAAGAPDEVCRMRRYHQRGAPACAAHDAIPFSARSSWLACSPGSGSGGVPWVWKLSMVLQAPGLALRALRLGPGDRLPVGRQHQPGAGVGHLDPVAAGLVDVEEERLLHGVLVRPGLDEHAVLEEHVGRLQDRLAAVEREGHVVEAAAARRAPRACRRSRSSCWWRSATCRPRCRRRARSARSGGSRACARRTRGWRGCRRRGS